MNYIELEEDIQAGLKKFDRRILCASIITILATVLGFFYYDYSKQLSSADLIGNMIEGRARNNQKEALLMLAAANAQNSFEAVALYDQHGKRYFHLPADLNPEFFRQDGLWNSLLYITIERPFYFSEENPSEVAGKIVFVYSTLPTWIGIAFLLFISYFLFYRPGKVRLKAFILEKLKAVSEKVKVKDIAGQVRHDWKSVKQGILAVAETSEGLAIDERETLLLGINRMDGLLSDLPDDENVLDQNTSSTQKAPVYIHPGTDLDQVVREKRISSRLSHCKQIDLTIQSEAFGAYLRFSSIDFKRIVGNLLKNSLEAIDERACQDQKDFLGKIHVFLSLGTDCIVLKVQDNGIGITKEQLSLIGKNRFSTKTNGEGRGISSARKKVERTGGTLTIVSTPCLETTITIELPRPDNLPWTTQFLDLADAKEIVILDDDPSDLDKTYNAVFSGIKNRVVRIRKFTTIDEFKKWLRGTELSTPVVLLIDYDLGDPLENGISISQQCKLMQRIYLVSNRYDDPLVQEQVAKSGLQIIPKPVISNFPLSI